MKLASQEGTETHAPPSSPSLGSFGAPAPQSPESVLEVTPEVPPEVPLPKTTAKSIRRLTDGTIREDSR